MLSEEELLVKIKGWKKVSPLLIARRLKVNKEEAERLFILHNAPTLEKTTEEATVAPVSHKRKYYPAFSLRFGVWALALLLFCNLIVLAYVYSSGQTEKAINWSGGGGSFCGGEGNIATISITGELVTYPFFLEKEETYTSADQVLHSLKKAAEDPSIRGIVVVIDSYGGSPVAAEEISKFLRSIQKPTVTLIRDQGLSGGYWVAAGGEHVVASALSDVGSIGVTASYLENSKQNEKEGLTYVPLASGKFKDAGNPDKPLTKEEEALFLRDIEKMHDIFVSEISTLRSLPLEKVKDIADGSSMLGGEARSLGLVDQVEGWQEVFDWLSEKIDTDIALCEDSAYYGLYK